MKKTTVTLLFMLVTTAASATEYSKPDAGLSLTPN